MKENLLYNRILKKLSKKKQIQIVSFDIFDTVLFRTIPSDYVSHLAAKHLATMLYQEWRVEISMKEILENRKQFSLSKKRYNREWTITEWLHDFAETLDINKEHLICLGKRAEIDAEISGVKLNPEIKPIITKLKKLNIRVIAISDIWLDQEDLVEILQNFGLDFDAVYTSGSIQLSKARRNIYKEIEGKNKNESDILHIGDNLFSDFINPRLAGWTSLWLPKRHPFLPVWVPKPLWKGFLKPEPKDYIVKIINSGNNSPQPGTPLYETGYCYLAPLLILFSLIQWKHFSRNKIDTVFFIARDAKLPFDVFKKISKYLPKNYDFYYCRLSRRALGILHPNNLLLNAEPLPGKIGRDTVGNWISNFTIRKVLKEKILRKAGLSNDCKFNPINREKIKIACNTYANEIFEEISYHSTLVQKYFKELSNNKPLSRVGMVDSGWAGTIQDCLSNVFQDAEIISGVYLGVGDQGKKPKRGFLKYGILRDDFRNCPHHNPLDASAGVIRVWDTLLREPVGSVLKLQYENNRTVPVLGDKLLISKNEEDAFNCLQMAVFKRIEDSLDQIKIFINLEEKWNYREIEKAALNYSKFITVFPSKEFANKIINLNIEEGTAAGQKISIGAKGIAKGIAWYPGIITILLGHTIGRIIISGINKIAVLRFLYLKNKH